MKNRKIRQIIYVIMILSAVFPIAAHAVTPDEARLKLAVFPFSNTDQKSLDTSISQVVKGELAKFDFIEVYPVETVTKKLYDLEPAAIWTEKKGRQKRGGIFWTIRPEIVEEFSRIMSADFSVIGDVATFGERWRIDVRVIEEGISEPVKSFSVTGLKEEEIPEQLAEASHIIADFLKGKSVLKEAEHSIRNYMGGIYSYNDCLEKIKGMVYSFPGSIPLRALLLDLYLKKKTEFADEVLRESLKIVELHAPRKDDDTRYLLSLNIDPFDIAAKTYEDMKDWERAISMRNTALMSFPYRSDIHKNNLGKDYYLSGVSLERNGHLDRALEHYERALAYLMQPSRYINEAEEGMKRLKRDQQQGEKKR